MKLMRWFNLLLIVALALAFMPIHTASAAPAAVEIDRNSLYVPGEVVVAFTDGLTSTAYGAQANALAGQVGATVVARYYNYALLSFPVDADVPAMVEKVAATGKATLVEPNYVSWIPEQGKELAASISGTSIDGTYTIQSADGQKVEFTRKRLAAMRRISKQADGTIKAIPTFPNEFTYSGYNTNGFDLINAEVIYRDTATTPGVCVIDTGVDANHSDLSGKIVNGYDFVNNDPLPNDDNGHGTHVAGIITAKGNNGSTSALGVSLGKVIAVKALSAYGWGTSYAISAAIRFCGNRTDAKVINMSLGSYYPSSIQYNALAYAINTKGKLVVAAAGNDSTSEFHYPSSWANLNVDVYGDWDTNANLSTEDNLIHKGLISVAAANVNPLYIPNWIDTNNDTNQEDSEDFAEMNCATYFTNYGVTVSIVAPGMDIFSTTPKSYAFFSNMYEGWRTGYEYLSGTSMAAPFVSAAAARVWSINTTKTKDWIKTKLISTGRPLDFVYDPYEVGVDLPFDPAYGFYQGTGEFGWQIDDENDPSDDHIKAPFCWPKDTDDPLNPFGEFEDMSNARYLDVAAAMGRYMVLLGGVDATNGMPLEGATIKVLKYNATTKVWDTKDTSLVSRYDPYVIMTNLTTPTTTSTTLQQYRFVVNKTGYTSGDQTYGYFYGEKDSLVGYDSNERMHHPVNGVVSVPPATDIQIVADWWTPGVDLDLYLWLPKSSAAKGVVGAWIGGYQPEYLTDYFPDCAPGSVCDYGDGTLLTNTEVFGAGSTTIMPFAQRYYDGGLWPSETIAVKMKPGTSYPYYSSSYMIYLTDYSQYYDGDWGGNAPALNMDTNFVYPTVRVWYKGVMKKEIQLYKATPTITPSLSCVPTAPTDPWPVYDWWYAGYFSGSTVTAKNTCSTSPWIDDIVVNGSVDPKEIRFIPYQ